MFIYTIYIYIYIMKGVRSSTFPCANVPTLEGTRSTNVTGREPLFLVSRLLTCIMTDVMADYLNGLHNVYKLWKMKINLMVEISTLRTMHKIAFLTSISPAIDCVQLLYHAEEKMKTSTVYTFVK